MNARIFILFFVCILFMSGCGNSNKSDSAELDIKTKELRQNDYRGGVMRAGVLKDTILALIHDMKKNNTSVRNDSPNNFWTEDNYQDFVSTFLDADIIFDTQWFNEEQTTWDEIIKQISTTPNSFTTMSNNGYSLQSGISIVRNEKDDYSITGLQGTLNTINASGIKQLSGKTTYRILFDCDKDWCKAYSNLIISNVLKPVTTQFFEYQRIDKNTFAIQTSKERLLVVFIPVEVDTDLRDRKVKEFYYSKLVTDGTRTSFTPFTQLPEKSETGVVLSENIKVNELMASYPQMNDKGDLSFMYGLSDSMFGRTAKTAMDWVFEDKSLQQGIAFKDGLLVVTTYNKLSLKYERFIYALPDAKGSVSELEAVVKVDELIGVNSTQIK